MIIRKEIISECVGLGCLRKQLLKNLEDGFTEKKAVNIEEELRKKLIKELKEGKIRIPT